MPIASSSAMCLSRATGSRPVQPAMTAESIGSVSGVVVSWASMTNARSNTEYPFDCISHFKDAAVRAAHCGERQADRHLSLAMNRQRYTAAINHVGQRAIAQREQVGLGEGVVLLHV